MGKRSNYARRERDYYATPAKGAAPLLTFLIRDGIRDFAEICAGNDHLVRRLKSAGLRCVYKGDIATGQDALKLTLADLNNAQAVITNPPTKYAEERGSTTRLLTDLLQHVLDLGVPAWWLIHHDWVTSLRAVPFLKHCSDIVHVRAQVDRGHETRRDGQLQLVPDRSAVSARLHPDPSPRRRAGPARPDLRAVPTALPAATCDLAVLFGCLPAARPSGRGLGGVSVT